MSAELRSLNLYRYDPTSHFEGSVTFNSPTGEIKLKLRPGLSDKILKAVAEELVESTKAVANEMTEEIFTQAAALPAPKP